MTVARVRRRPRAASDIESAVEWLIRNAPAPAALSFLDAIEGALATLREHPFIGTDWTHRTGIPHLRGFLLKDHPYVVLYLASSNEVDVVRVLHTSRDVEWTLLCEER